MSMILMGSDVTAPESAHLLSTYQVGYWHKRYGITVECCRVGALLPFPSLGYDEQ